MHLTTARLCLNCEQIHEEKSCPRCGSTQFELLCKWVPPIHEGPLGRAQHHNEAMYFRLTEARAS